MTSLRQLCNPLLGPVQRRSFFCYCQVLFLLLAITDFIITDRSFGGLASILYTSPLSERCVGYLM